MDEYGFVQLEIQVDPDDKDIQQKCTNVRAYLYDNLLIVPHPGFDLFGNLCIGQTCYDVIKLSTKDNAIELACASHPLGHVQGKICQLDQLEDLIGIGMCDYVLND